MEASLSGILLFSVNLFTKDTMIDSNDAHFVCLLVVQQLQFAVNKVFWAFVINTI